MSFQALVLFFLSVLFGFGAFAEEPSTKPVIVEKNESGRLVSRRESVDGVLGAGFELGYFFDVATQRFFPNSFRIFDKQGQVIRSRNAFEYLPCGFVRPRKQEFAMIMDIVVADTRHLDLRDQIWVNPKETKNGIDDDGNGLIDDCGGYTVQAWKSNAPLVAPMVDAMGRLNEINHESLLPDVDHATMTLSIAARGLKQVDFIPVAGDLQKKNIYEAMIRTIADEKIRFVNISLGVPGLPLSNDGESLSDPTAYYGMKKLIEESPRALFTVAAGNGAFIGNTGINIDRLPIYPAAFWMKNILVVAAANMNEVNRDKLPETKLSTFSNVGVIGVDVVAPGERMHVALSGGGWGDEAKGTSFAAPYVMNLALQLAVQYPKLSIEQIKELIMKTVFIPDLDLALTMGSIDNPIKLELELNPRFFPVRSGGVVFPDRLFKAAEFLKADPTLTIEQAALKARDLVLVPGELSGTEAETKLRQLWKDRNMAPSESLKPF